MMEYRLEEEEKECGPTEKINEARNTIVSPDKLFQRRSFKAFDYFNSVLGAPRHVVAPMSELAFRLLTRRYGAHLCYTPMLYPQSLGDPEYRQREWQTTSKDRPLVAQICGNDWRVMLQGAQLIQGECDAIDINLGCPQGVAKRGHFGAFLMEDFDTVQEIVEKLSANLNVPLFCKIRIFNSHKKTIQFAQMLEKAGCMLLCVHGRTKEMKKHSFRDGRHAPANWDLIAKIREAVSIPVVVNGSIQYFGDVERCLQHTGAQGVMSAISVLENPAFFSGLIPDRFSLVFEYLEICKQFPPPLSWAQAHVWKMLKQHVSAYETLQAKLFEETKSFEDIEEVVKELQYAVQHNVPPQALRPPKYIPEEMENVLEDLNAFEVFESEE